jgi:hypothetical protein
LFTPHVDVRRELVDEPVCAHTSIAGDLLVPMFGGVLHAWLLLLVVQDLFLWLLDV